MAGNPIKHDEIIEQGNPFDDTIKGIQAMIKLLDKLTKDLKKSATEWQKFTQKQNVSTKQGQENLKKAAKATQELTVREKEALKIKKQLEREQAKLNLIGSEEHKQLIRTKEAIRAKNAELRKSAKAMVTGAKNTNTWRKALGSFAAKFNTIGNIAGSVFMKITAAAKTFIREAVQMSLQMEGVQNAFEKLNDPKLLGNLQKATRGMVNNLDLMKGAVSASNLRIPLEKLATFFEFATNRSLETGESVDFLVDSIVKGLGRKSVLILDNLGLNVLEINEEFKKTGNFVEAASNIIEREMKRAGVVLDTNLVLMQQMNTEFQNFKIDAGTALQQVTLGFRNLARMNISKDGMLDVIVNREVKKALKELGEEMDAFSAKRLEDANITHQWVKEVDEAGITSWRLVEVGRKVVEIEEEEIETLKTLREQLSFKKAVVEETNIADIQALLIAKAEVKALEDQIKAVEDLGVAKKKAAMEELEDDSFIFNQIKATNQFALALKNGAAKEEENINKATNDAIEAENERMLASVKQQEKDEVQAAQDAEDAKQDAINASINAAQQASNAFFSFQQTQSDNFYDAEQQKIDDKFEAEIAAADGNADRIKQIQERQKEETEELQAEQAKEDQDRALSMAAVNAALGATKTIANLGFPAAIPALIAQAAVLAFQIAAIKSVQFEEGGSGMLDDEGHILQGASHGAGGINPVIEAEGGEYFGVINKRMTKKYSDVLPTIIDSLNKGKFHDVFSRSNIELNKSGIFSDPYNKMTYERLGKMANVYTDSRGDTVKEYLNGRKRIIRGSGRTIRRTNIQ